VKLIEFKLKKYRSFSSEQCVRVFDLTTIVGPNNSGKSNLLQAMIMGLKELSGDNFRNRRRPVGESARDQSHLRYRWETDFPLNLKDDSRSSNETELTYTFDLDDDDRRLFKDKLNVNLKSELKIKLTYNDQKSEPTFDVVIRGKSKKTLMSQSDKIIEFIRENLLVQYISSDRGVDASYAVVRSLLTQRLNALRSTPEYRKLEERIRALEEPVLDELASSLKSTVVEFVPEIVDVNVESQRFGGTFRRPVDVDVMIDDGEVTELSFKGDGLQSLAAVAMMRYMTQDKLEGRTLILAIEEPESHLHPSAIHRLRSELKSLSLEHQLILTTHSPILVNRSMVESNVIVSKGAINTTNNINEIRDELGIRVSDNLISAELVLCVEGEDDKLLIELFLREISSLISDALDSGILIIDALGGASKLSYKADLYHNLLCDVVAFLDNDKEGKLAMTDCIDEGKLDSNQIVVTSLVGRRETEFEDVLVDSLWTNILKTDYNVTAHNKYDKGAKWSKRVETFFYHSGAPWSDQIEAELKWKVAQAAVPMGFENCVHESKRGPIFGLRDMLEQAIGTKSNEAI